MCIKLLSPRRPRIGKQDIHMISRLAHFLHQSFYISDLSAVSGHADGLGAGTLVREGVEGGAGLVAGRGFAGGYVDFGAAGLEEAGEGEGRR